MSINEIIIGLMAVFLVLGALDRIAGNRFGLGERFEEGIQAMGALALAMIGILCLAPVLSDLLRPVVVPVYAFLGADPAMFAGTILANDMGGAALARELALTEEAGQFGGLIVGAMLGPTIVFTIPVALGILKQEDLEPLARGVLCGVVTIPLGAFAGGLTAGFPVGMVLRNLIPIVLIALLLALGLWRIPGAMVKGFAVFGKVVVAVITVGLAAAIVESLTGLVLIPGMAPIQEGFAVVGEIAIVLAGAFPPGLCHYKSVPKAPAEAGAAAGGQRRGGGGTGGYPGQQHPHVRHGVRHGPPGQGGQRGLCRVGGLRLRRPPGLYGGL